MVDAQKQASDSPLWSMFGTAFRDADGKIVAKSEAAWSGDEDSAGDLEGEIAQAERTRREYFVRIVIGVAGSSIIREHFVSDQEIGHVLRQSPVVPPRLLHTMSVGFKNFFRGEYVSAMYILTPMVEGIFRHVLKTAGHDVSTLNDATCTQEDMTISALYDSLGDELKAIFGTALTDDVHRVFLAKHGPNIRNGVAHALYQDEFAYCTDAFYGCWLIWHICCLPLVECWGDIFPIAQPDVWKLL